MKILVAFLGSTFLATITLGLSPECSYGESYWCSSLQRANECNAFTHCMTTVWRNKQLTQDNDEVCQFCENIMKDVKDFVTSKQTEAQIVQYLDTACSLLPTADLQTQCKSVIKQQLDQLIQMVQQNLDPQTICATVGLCKGLEDTVQHRPIAHKPVVAALGLNLCTDCEAFFKNVKEFLSSPGAQKELEDILNAEVCSQMGTYSDTCKALVVAYVPQLAHSLESVVSPTVVCKTLTFCSADEKILFMDYVRKLNSEKVGIDACADCKAFFTDVKQVLADKTAQKEFMDVLESQVCPQLGALQDECKQLISAYLPQLIQMLESDVDPAQICSKLTFCKSHDQTVKLIGDVVKGVMNAKVGADTCADCKAFFGDVKSILSSPAVQKQLEDIIKNQVCPQFASMADQCKQLVDEYIPKIVQALEMDPALVCGAIGFCKGQQVTVLRDLITRLNVVKASAPVSSAPKPTPVKASTQCVVCEFVITQIDKMLTNNKTEAEIEAALMKVCSVLPSTVKDDCDSFVSQYGPAVIALLLQEVKPAQVCTSLGLCTGLQQKPVRAGELCSVCKLMIQYLDSLISEKPTEAEIEQALDRVCNFLPDTYKSECDQIVAQYTPLLIKILLQEASPAEVCSLIQLCTSSPLNRVKVGGAKPLGVRVFGGLEKQPIKAETSKLLGLNPCTWGPSYWCKNKDNAHECNAVAHCEKHVWSGRDLL